MSTAEPPTRARHASLTGAVAGLGLSVLGSPVQAQPSALPQAFEIAAGTQYGVQDPERPECADIITGGSLGKPESNGSVSASTAPENVAVKVQQRTARCPFP